MSDRSEIERLKNRAYDLLAFEAGEIDEAEWHRRVAAFIVPAYLSADNPRSQSGFGRDEAAWEDARGMIMEAVNRDGSFLDVGCASGHLMECVERWANAKGLRVEAYGLDISPELANLARTRLPEMAHRIYTGNAQYWEPPFQFDYVRTCLEYVPRPLRESFVRRLMSDLVRPGGTLIVGSFGEEADANPTEGALAEWGLPISGRFSRPHPTKPTHNKVIWILKVDGLN
jgi:SAM-dependent methyltransferase